MRWCALTARPANSQSFRIEGQDASNTGTPGVAQQTQPSVDAIQEIAIQTSNYAAEYGQVGGGMFNVTMRSGANQFHGSAYDYFVNEIFNAGNPFVTGSPQGNPRARARRNDYGFTGGGPVWIPKVYNGHDKTFFFFNWEQFREQTKVNNQFQTVPIAAYRTGDFSAAILPNAQGDRHRSAAGTPMLEGMIYDPDHERHRVSAAWCPDSVPRQQDSRDQLRSGGGEDPGAVSGAQRADAQRADEQLPERLQHHQNHRDPVPETRPDHRSQRKIVVLLAAHQDHQSERQYHLRPLRRPAGSRLPEPWAPSRPRLCTA